MTTNISVKLDTFEGPLDLLLHLIKKEKVDIYDIPIAEITHQYLDYLNRLEQMNIYVAGEFLLMAATLIYIKSKMLLPKKVDVQQEITGDVVTEEEDPRMPLVRRLVEYQKIKELSESIEKGNVMYRDFYPRGYTEFKIEYFDDELDAYELAKLFYALVKKMPESETYNVELENISIMDKMNEVMDYLKERNHFNFMQYAGKAKSRLELIVFFLALLELTKLRMVYLRQVKPFSDFEVGLRVEEKKNGE